MWPAWASVRPAQLPQEAKTFDANVTLVNFKQSEESKVREALSLIRKVVASPLFRERLLGYQFQGKTAFHQNKGLSNAEIYQLILEASEKLTPGKNNRMDLELELYHEATNTIGYTYPNVSKIWINRKYFDRYTPVQVADNIFHEWLHKLGFDHDSTWNKSRKHSVPYAVGYLVEDLARELENEFKL